MKPSTKIILTLLLSTIVFLPGSAWAASGDVVKEFPTPGRCPAGLTYDATTKTLWLSDRMSDKLYQINPKDGKVLRTLDAPDFQIEGLAMQGDKLWAIDIESKKAYLVNTKTGITERTIEIYCSQPTGLAFDGRYLWTSTLKKGRIYKINPVDGTTVSTYRTPNEEASGFTFDGRYLWVSDRLHDEIYMVNPRDGRVIVTIPSPGKFPRDLAYDGKNLWNVDYQSDKIYKMVRFDKENTKYTHPKRRSLYCGHEIHNGGPGIVTSADIYFAIPRNMPSQKLLSQCKITPKPVEIMTNDLGQKVARCNFKNIKPGERAVAFMEIDAELYRTNVFIDPEKTGTLADVPKEIKEKYLVNGAKFDIKDSFIQKMTRRVVGGEKNCYWIARRIYNYVLNEIEYERVAGWNSASHVLRSGKGSCSEFSFSLIAMCRAAGLPARFVGSVVVRYDDASTDYGVYHRWAQVYLPNYGWVTFDPSSSRANTPIPAKQASAIGFLDHRYMITTIGNRDTKGLEWDYNSNATWQTKGPAKVTEERVGEWEPMEDSK